MREAPTAVWESPRAPAAQLNLYLYNCMYRPNGGGFVRMLSVPVQLSGVGATFLCLGRCVLGWRLSDGTP